MQSLVGFADPRVGVLGVCWVFTSIEITITYSIEIPNGNYTQLMHASFTVYRLLLSIFMRFGLFDFVSE